MGSSNLSYSFQGFDYREVFKKIDDDFRMIMNDTQRDKRVVTLLRIGSIKSILSNMLDRLERCQKSLNEVKILSNAIINFII